MNAAMRRSGARLLLPMSVALACGATTACLQDAGGPVPEGRPLEFISLAAPSQVAAGESATVEVSLLVGTSGCWRIENLSALRQGDVVRLEGNAILPDPRGFCTAEVVYSKQAVSLPPWAVGTYAVVAGQLSDTLTVIAGPSGSLARFTFRGALWPMHPRVSGCASVVHPALRAVLSGVPIDPIGGELYLIRGDITADSPCLQPGSVEEVDYLVAVREMTLVE